MNVYNRNLNSIKYKYLGSKNVYISFFLIQSINLKLKGVRMKVVNYLLLGLVVLMTGCAQKVQVKALDPAEIGAMASKKKVAVTGFKNDKVGLSGKIEAEIAKHTLDDKKYFTVLSRADLDKVMKEQKLQSSTLMSAKTASKIGKLVGAQALINGKVTSSGKEGSYVEDREKCLQYYKDGSGCAQFKHYKVTCKTTQAGLNASINIVDMDNGRIVHADTISKEYNADSCKFDSAAASKSVGGGFLGAALGAIASTAKTSNGTILTKEQALQRLSNEIADEFVHKLAPHYVYFEVTLLDSIEFEVEDAQAATLEGALGYIKGGRMDKAESIMSKLNDQLNGKSYVVAYDLGVVKEAQGKLAESKKMYAMADELSLQPVPEINEAVLRIEKLIAKRSKAQAQINR